MKPFVFIFLTLFFLSFQFSSNGQTTQYPNAALASTISHHHNKKATYIIPASFVVYGIFTLKNNELQKINRDIQGKVMPSDPSKKIHLDDYLQYAPGVIGLGMSACGVKGKCNFGDVALIYLTTNIISTIIVVPTKHFSHELRPDSSNFSSFPSGHTATAFANAEFFRIQYGKRYPLLAVTSYAMAATTGYLRIYNNKHWFSDVLSGAAVGFCSARITDRLYHFLQKKYFPLKNKQTIHTIALY